MGLLGIYGWGAPRVLGLELLLLKRKKEFGGGTGVLGVHPEMAFLAVGRTQDLWIRVATAEEKVRMKAYRTSVCPSIYVTDY